MERVYMSDLRCSFCLSEDEDRKYLSSDHNEACVCSNCAMMLAQYVLNQESTGDELEDTNFDGFKNDAIVAVSADGLDLENFEELQDDYDVVMAAVNNNGGSLQFASERLRADKEIVIAAVKNDPYVIEFASDDLQDDDDVLDACEAEED